MENCKKSMLNPCASLPNMKFCAFIMQKKQEKEKIGHHFHQQTAPKIVAVGEKLARKNDPTKLPKLFSELTLQADEELRNLMSIENPFYYDAFLCHNSDHNKENDLTSVAAEIFRNRVSEEEEKNRNETTDDEDDEIRIKFDLDRKDFKGNNNNSNGKALIFGSRLIDPVAWTLNLREKAFFVPILS